MLETRTKHEMRTTDDYSSLENYAFNSSPDSGESEYADIDNLEAEDDFLHRAREMDMAIQSNLPSDDGLSILDSPGDSSNDGMFNPSYPSSFLSDGFLTASPDQQDVDMELFWQDFESGQQSPPYDLDINTDVDFKTEALSPAPSSPGLDTVVVSPQPVLPPLAAKVPIKKLVSKPTMPVPPIVVINTPGTQTKALSPRPKVVVLDNMPRVIPKPIAPPMTIKTESGHIFNLNNLDQKALKRQQRKIKNRESACLSRKKKKDYLTSLENQVRDLTIKNEELIQENAMLKQRLSRFETTDNSTGSTSYILPKAHIKTVRSIMLCMMVLAVGFHMDFIRNPFLSRNRVGLANSNDLTPKLDHHSRNLLWSDGGGVEGEISQKNQSNFSPLSMCPAAINQTESARLVLELERWIGRPPFEGSETATGSKMFASNSTTNVVKAKHVKKALRKQRRQQQQQQNGRYQQDSSLMRSMYRVSEQNSDNSRELQVFSPTLEQLYSEFFEAINRQDDTFYVVSFSDHHMLLPALYHNKTRRPKMSLIMPSVLANNGNSTQTKLVPLMQIDCEVLDTRLIQIQYGTIPQQFRTPNSTTNYQNASSTKPSEEPQAANYTKKAYKPYFIKKNSIKPENVPEVYNLS